MSERLDCQAPLHLIAPSALARDTGVAPLSIAILKVLQRRQSGRAFKPDELALYTLSHLLWAAFGINRPELGRRTAPSAKTGTPE
jgi:hypothetical protein